MPSNRTSNDIDLVQPTWYKVPPNRVAKKPPPEPLHINNFDDYGTPNLPPTLDRNDPFAIFSQFFTIEIMDKLVEWTNKYAELHPSNDAGEKLRARQAGRNDGHKKFRRDLRDALFKRSIRGRKAYTQDAPLRCTTDDRLWYPTHHHSLKRLWLSLLTVLYA